MLKHFGAAFALLFLMTAAASAAVIADINGRSSPGFGFESVNGVQQTAGGVAVETNALFAALPGAFANGDGFQAITGITCGGFTVNGGVGTANCSGGQFELFDAGGGSLGGASFNDTFTALTSGTVINITVNNAPTFGLLANSYANVAFALSGVLTTPINLVSGSYPPDFISQANVVISADQPVPEPATVGSMVLGFVFIAAGAYRRNRRNRQTA